MNDNLIICPKCGGDACYKNQVSIDITNYLCYGCGFQTNSLMKIGEEFYEEQLQTLPELYKDIIFTDNDGLCWIPSYFDIQGKGSVFVLGKSADKWGWGGMKHIIVDESEKEMFKNPKGGYYKYKTDTQSLKTFPREDFIEALDYIGMFESLENED